VRRLANLEPYRMNIIYSLQRRRNSSLSKLRNQQIIFPFSLQQLILQLPLPRQPILQASIPLLYPPPSDSLPPPCLLPPTSPSRLIPSSFPSRSAHHFSRHSIPSPLLTQYLGGVFGVDFEEVVEDYEEHGGAAKENGQAVEGVV
jgi:hypothetical protein